MNKQTVQAPASGISSLPAIYFVILLGVVSLWADMTYEGARSITGPFLATLGASATVVGVVAGLGELFGYGLRLVSGYLSDRTARYWTIVGVGYALNLLVVPLLAFAGRWEMAALLMVTERTGKAIRTPARDAILSHATALTGRGWGFGLHEAMDQVGAVMGPLLVALVLYQQGTYRHAFSLLLVPALLAMVTLMLARQRYPQPRDFEADSSKLEAKGLPRAFWWYLVATAFIAMGYADFPLIAYHFHHKRVFTAGMIPLFYAVAMGADAIAALVLGRLFDRIGIPVLILATLISAFFAPLIFMGGLSEVFLGTVLWGLDMGVQESILRAVVAAMVPIDRRGSGYGIFHAAFGASWFLGSALMGFLYDHSILALVVFSAVVQLLSVPFLLWLKGDTSL